jgi:hypothetical protein
MQERRQNSKTNMHLNNVRVVFSGQQYYANVQITTEAIIIKPHDEEIPVTHFLPVHLRGYSEVENRGLRINQRFNRPPYNLYFRTPAQCARALRRIRVITGYCYVINYAPETGQPCYRLQIRNVQGYNEQVVASTRFTMRTTRNAD